MQSHQLLFLTAVGAQDVNKPFPVYRLTLVFCECLQVIIHKGDTELAYEISPMYRESLMPDNLCSLLDLLPLAPPFLLNSLHLLLHHVLGETLFEPKEAPILTRGVFDAVLATVQVE